MIQGIEFCGVSLASLKCFLRVPMCVCLRLCAHTQLFLERERAAVLAEAQTDDLISEAPKAQADQSGQWQETSGEIQWVAVETNETNEKKEEKKEEEDEELDLNKGTKASYK